MEGTLRGVDFGKVDCGLIAENVRISILSRISFTLHFEGIYLGVLV